jgi:hypothetical protein
MLIYTYVYIYICIYIYTFICIYIYVYLYMYKYMYVYMNTYIHIHIGITRSIGQDSYCHNDNTINQKSSKIHDFDEVVQEKDAYSINKDLEGSIFHFFSSHTKWGASEAALKSKSLYSEKHFPSVIEDLRKRGLELLVCILYMYECKCKQDTYSRKYM